LEAAAFVADCFASASAAQRVALGAKIDSALATKLAGVCGYLAERAINEREAKWLTRALICAGLASRMEDNREIIRHLVLVVVAGEMLSVDQNTLFNHAIAAFDEDAAVFLKSFLSRPSDLNRLAQYGVRSEWKNGLFAFEAMTDPF
jgi:phage shock protein PspC (stress-responsive transcriptional regulator)